MILGLHDLYFAQFMSELGKVVSTSRPVEQHKHLKGRADQLDTIQQAIFTAGKHVFVYGERGVGKTSLAKTAALESASNSSAFKQIGCASDSTFANIVQQVIEVFDPRRLTRIEKTRRLVAQSFLGMSGETKKFVEPMDLNVSQVAATLKELDEDGYNQRRVVVIDEMENLVGDEVKKNLASLIKLLGDLAAQITFVFTGVGSDVKEIIGSHLSAHRQLAQIHLDRLSYNDALDIIDDALAKFNLSWEIEPTRTARFRIASIANGFPYYVHLLLDKLLNTLYKDRGASSITLVHLSEAFGSAVRDAEEHVKQPYDDATRGRDEKYKLATWAAADSWDLERTAEEIYVSYKRICGLREVDAVNKSRFLRILHSLKQDDYGPILAEGFRKGQYKFSENFVRGYVRLCAAAEGVELEDTQPGGAPTKAFVFGSEKRYVDPRKYGGPPSMLRK